MKIPVQGRLARLAGLLLLSLLVAAVIAPAAVALLTTGSGTGTGASYSAAVSGQEGRGGVTGQVAGPALIVGAAPAAAAPVTSDSSGISTTTWVVIGVAVAALVVALVAWAFARRRSRLAADSQQYCSLHPDDALCGAV